MESMSTPATREEFERRMNILSERARQGKLVFPAHQPRLVEGILKVRWLPNGRIDLLSIDETARLYANTANQFSDRFRELVASQAAQNSDSGETFDEKGNEAPQDSGKT